jgi:hypothetical protein
LLALQVLVNGKPVATAGTAGAANVCCTIDALGDEIRRLKPGHGPVIVRLGGISHESGKPANLLTWFEAMSCVVGDEITLCVLDAPDADIPRATALLPDIARSLLSRPSLWARFISRFSRDGRAAS